MKRFLFIADAYLQYRCAGCCRSDALDFARTGWTEMQADKPEYHCSGAEWAAQDMAEWVD